MIILKVLLFIVWCWVILKSVNYLTSVFLNYENIKNFFINTQESGLAKIGFFVSILLIVVGMMFFDTIATDACVAITKLFTNS